MEGHADDRSVKVLLLAADREEAAATESVLREAGSEYAIFYCASELCKQIEAGAGILILAEDALKSCGSIGGLKKILGRQPGWSELPIVLIARGGAAAEFSRKLMKELGGMLIVDQPVSPSTLLNVIEYGLCARNRQYDIRDHLLERAKVKDVLENADRKKDEFLAVLAHELRNPMAAISAAASLLARKNLRPEQSQLATDALKQRVAQLSRLVDDLLDVSRIARGKIELHKEMVDLSVVAGTAVEAARGFFEERKQLCELTLSEPLIIKGDTVRLEQIVSNLLSNASRYTPAGGQILVRAARERQQAVISVKDNGMGISKESLSRIFDLFGQAEDSLHRSKGGLGIGLTIVHKLAEMHGGTVTAESEGPDKGSEFIVRFPLLNLQLPLPFGERDDMAWVEPGLRVLIVEDHSDTAAMSSALLEMGGHRVRVALDGPSGVRAAIEEEPEVVLLDIGLPGMDGFAVAKELRRKGLTDSLIIAVTGYGQEKDLELSREAGFDHYLIKPLRAKELNPLLARFQKARKARLSAQQCR